jgi:hypothetical protein
VVSQQYSTGSEEEYVIKGNSATLKCKIPSFVNDFVTVDSWLDSEGNVYSMQDTPDYGRSARLHGRFGNSCLNFALPSCLGSLPQYLLRWQTVSL